MKHLLKLLLSIVVLSALSTCVRAQTCNPPSGWLVQNGQITTGNNVTYGPGCGQVQDGGTSSPGMFFVPPGISAGNSDNTTNIQSAINSACAVGNGTVMVPPGGPYIVLGTLTITCSNIQFQCASRGTVIQFNNTNKDDFQIGYQVAQLQQIKFSDCYFNHSGKTGGISINMKNAAIVLFDNISIDHPWNGIYNEKVNTIAYDHVFINQPLGAYAVNQFNTAGSGNRTDVVTFKNFDIGCAYSGADAFRIDGPTFTMRWVAGGINACRRGLWVQNSAASATDFPQFIFFDDIEIDGASDSAVVLDAGVAFKFVNSDFSNTSGSLGQGNADNAAFICNPDTGHSNTNNIQISNGRIGNTRKQAALVNCSYITFDGTTFTDASKTGVNAFPMVEIGAAATHVNFNGGFAGAITGVTNRTSAGIQIDANASFIEGNGIDLTGNTAELVNNSNALSIFFNTAWRTFTLNPVCGTATFSNVSSRFNVLRKIVYFAIDLTFNAIGTCTNGLTINLPSLLPNGGVSGAGRDGTVTGKTMGCANGAGATTMTCSFADNTNFAAGSKIQLSGSYESQ